MSQDNQSQQARHVAIIMDGNGRWAQARGLPRLAGHRQGVEAVRKVATGLRVVDPDLATESLIEGTNPLSTREQEVRALFAGMRERLAEVGAALVGGHTEVTEAVNQPVVIGQMLGHAAHGRVVPTGGMQAGDRVRIEVGNLAMENPVES